MKKQWIQLIIFLAVLHFVGLSVYLRYHIVLKRLSGKQVQKSHVGKPNTPHNDEYYRLVEADSLDLILDGDEATTDTPNDADLKHDLLSKKLAADGVRESVGVNSSSRAYWSWVAQQDFSKMNAKAVYKRLLSSPEVSCPLTQRAGSPYDGGYDVCVTSPFGLGKHCLVYSFGINYEFSFDDFMDKKHNCSVYSFDPSMKFQEGRRRKKAWFYKIGIGSARQLTDEYRDGKLWKLLPLDSILRKFHHSEKTLDVLKIDIEGAEWGSLQAALREGSLKNVKQIVMELHADELFHKETTVERWRELLQFLLRLRKAGFSLWRAGENELGKLDSPDSCCYDVAFVNLNYVTQII